MEQLSTRIDRPRALFDLDAYLDERSERSEFVMVELGHGSKPAAFGNPDSFTAGRAYIGVEAWRRDRAFIRREMVAQQLGRHASKNIFFIDRSSSTTREDGYSGASELLPDGIADELLLANTLGDPDVTREHTAVSSLLHETKRLLAPGGKLIIRETTTPPNWIAVRESMRAAGLEPEAAIRTHDADEWSQLETIYGGGGMHIYTDPASYYIFAS